MVGHVKIDLEAMKASDCLLSIMTSSFVVVEPEATLEGAYVIYDAANAKFIRSGKASPVTIAKRFEDHKKEAKKSERKDFTEGTHIKQTQTFGQKFEVGFLTNCTFFALSDSIGTT